MSDSQATAVEEHSLSRKSFSSLRWLAIVPTAILAGWLVHCFNNFVHFLRNPGYPCSGLVNIMHALGESSGGWLGVAAVVSVRDVPTSKP